MNVKDILETADRKLDIKKLRPMQERMLHEEAERVVLAAPTGSGKTLAFTFYVLRRLKESARGEVQAVVTVPSRELAIQVADVMRRMAAGYKTTVLYGGHKMEEEVKSLTPVPDIIIATPGRLTDHLERGTVELSSVRTVVLDEYDKSLELGFEREMKYIFKRLKGVKNIVLTSATRSCESMPDWIGEGAFISLDYTSSGKPELDIVEVESPSKDKAQTLVDLLYALPAGGKTIVFVNHRESAERLHVYLRKHRITAALYHGGLDQHRRETALTLFANGSAPVLVSTDLAGRGLDIAEVDAVVHYHLPPSVESWIHRNGRTARNGAAGEVYIIISEADNVPDYVRADRKWYPPESGDRKSVRSDISTLHINAGKKDKISKGDIVGYLTGRGGVDGKEIGAIKLMDHESLVAVPSAKIADIISQAERYKLKNQKVRLSEIKA